VITQWSPALRKALITDTVAAMPVENNAVPAAFSRVDILFSSAFTVGLAVREYE